MSPAQRCLLLPVGGKTLGMAGGGEADAGTWLGMWLGLRTRLAGEGMGEGLVVGQEGWWCANGGCSGGTPVGGVISQAAGGAAERVTSWGCSLPCPPPNSSVCPAGQRDLTQATPLDVPTSSVSHPAPRLPRRSGCENPSRRLQTGSTNPKGPATGPVSWQSLLLPNGARWARPFASSLDRSSERRMKVQRRRETSDVPRL